MTTGPPLRKAILSLGFGNNPAAAAAGISNINEIIRDQGQKAQELGFDLKPMFLNPESEAESLQSLEAELRKQNWDGIIVGGGVRMRPEHTVLFEKIVNKIVQETKGGATVVFPAGPDQIVPALIRNFPGMASST